MTQIPRLYINNFTKALNAISEEMRRRLAKELEAVNMTQDVTTVREQVVAIMQAYCGGATDMAATLAAEFYDGLRRLELGEPMGALAVSGRKPEATEGAVRAFAQKLVDGDPERFVELCLERLDYETKVSASTTVINNGRRDRARPKYARVPSGAETCDFCLMLASRGFVYMDEAAASHTHANCDCRVVPSWKAQSVEGYDPDALYDQWQGWIDQTAAERAERNGTTVDDEREAIMARYRQSAKNANQRRKERRQQ